MKQHTIRLTTPQLDLVLLAANGLATTMRNPGYGWTQTDRTNISHAIDTLTKARFPEHTTPRK